jgi:putative phosphoesterase
MKIGIISDTHDYLPSPVFEIFNSVELIIHAGDIGNENIITELQTIAPVKAVFGNMDRFPLVSNLKRIEVFTLDQCRICLTHIIGTHKYFAYELYKMNLKVDAVIHGHTHRVENNIYNNIRFLNPGSVSQPKSSSRGSVGILNIDGREMEFDINYI